MSRIYRRKGRRGWWLDYYSNGERIRRPAGTTDKTTALQALAAAETHEVRKSIGIVDDSEIETRDQSSRPIEEHFEDFLRFLKVSGSSETHLGGTKRHLYRLAGECSWKTLADVNEDSLVRWLDGAVAAKKAKKPLSDRTRQSYCQSITSFTKWARRKKRVAYNPLESFQRPQVRTQDYKRRAITKDEWLYVQNHLRTTDKTKLGMSSQERSILYELALVTALRAKEIASLTRSKFNLEKLFVRCLDTKNGKAADQALTPTLAGALKRHLLKKLPAAKAFAISDLTGLAETIRGDFTEARAVWISEEKDPEKRTNRESSDFLAIKNGEGEILDFHSLRHTCGAWLALAGLHPKIIQRIMRHSSITLTMDTYGHLFPEQETAAIEALQKATRR